MFDHLDPDRPFEPRPDALRAVEARAARLRRRRVGAQVTGMGSLALVAVVVAVLLADPGDRGVEVTQAGDRTATTEVSPAPTTTSSAPAAPTTTVAGPTTTASPGPTTTTKAVPAAPADPPVTATTATGDLWVGVEVQPARPEPGRLFRVRVSVRDRDGTVTSFRLAYGDGDDVGFAADIACPAEPPAAVPSDDAFDYEHAYRRPGRYEVAIEIETTSCADGGERARVVVPIEVAGGVGPSNGPRRPTASFALAGPTADPATGTLAATVTGADDDGYVSVIEVEWGDGAKPQVARFLLDRCEDTDRQWPTSQQSVQHQYRPGTYSYRVKVTSVGCDGEDAQEAVIEGRTDVLPPAAERAA